MKASELTLRQLLDGRRQYAVPLFQRKYSWLRAHHEQLWRDVLDLYEIRLEEPKAQHFLGSVVTAEIPSGPDRPELFVLIDGQQRLTTLAILLAAIRDGHSEDGNDSAASMIDDLYLKNQHAQGTDLYKVLPTQEDRGEFAAIASGAAATGHAVNMRSAYRWFRQELSRPDSSGDPIGLEQLAAAVLDGLSLVSIWLEESDNAYRVFESLNATGLPLSQVDLLRNYFFMRLPADQGEQLYAQVWLPMEAALGGSFNEFAHDYFTKDGHFIREGEVYREAKRRLDPRSADEVADAIHDLKWFSDRWERILRPELEPNDEVRRGLQRLRQFGSATVWPFVLNLYEARDRYESLDAAEVARVLRMLESFLVRRMFARVPTNQLNRLFLRLWDQLPKLRSVEAEVRAALSEPSRRWPRDSEFVDAIATYPLYTDSRGNQRRLVLEQLERALPHKEPVALDHLQIEHVLPQTLTPEWVVMLTGDEAAESEAVAIRERWLHTLPNLTLTGYNPEMANDPWETKRTYYAASHVELSRRLAEFERWTETEMAERADALAKLALTIWPGPAPSSIEIATDDESNSA